MNFYSKATSGAAASSFMEESMDPSGSRAPVPGPVWAVAAFDMNIICAQPALTDSEVIALRRAAMDGPKRDRLLLELALTTGLRITSLLGTTFGRVLAGGEVRSSITVPRFAQKNGRSRYQRSVTTRVLPLTAPVQAMIQELVFERFGSEEPPAQEPLFVSRQGGCLSRRQATHRLKEMFLAAGITDRPGFGWHACRRWFATTAYRVATHHDVVSTSRMLGHASLQPTVTYLSLDQASVASGFQGVASRLIEFGDPMVGGKGGLAVDASKMKGVV